jgi:hypothetical protein
MNAARTRPGASATPSAVHRRDGPARYAVASTAAMVNRASSTTVRPKKSRPRWNGSLTGRTSQATACMAPPIRTGYSTGCPEYGTLPADSPSAK